MTEHGRLIDADALIADCQLAQKQADGYGREFANAFYSGSGEISTEWWCVEDLIENAPTIEPEPDIIHCRECIHAMKDELFGGLWCKGKAVTNYHYCGDAERRTDGTEQP